MSFKKLVPTFIKSYLLSVITPRIDNYELFFDDYNIIKKNTMCPLPRLASLWQQVRYVDEIKLPGAFVECGVYKGGCIGLMALAHLRMCRERELHLFDSFEGLPAPNSELDGDIAIDYYNNNKNKKYGLCIGSIDENSNLLEHIIRYPVHLINYHKGWFQDTVPIKAKEIPKIAILRLDGDWYESTKICFENLYDNVVTGGFIIIDDYGTYEGCKKATDEFLMQLPRKPFLVDIDFGCRYFIKQ
jgi:hypothetical protein